MSASPPTRECFCPPRPRKARLAPSGRPILVSSCVPTRADVSWEIVVKVYGDGLHGLALCERGRRPVVACAVGTLVAAVAWHRAVARTCGPGSGGRGGHARGRPSRRKAFVARPAHRLSVADG